MQAGPESIQPEYDVLIVGCGPVGGVLALLLGRAGVRVCLVEQASQQYDKPRAIVLDWEGMRALQFCGIAHDLFSTTAPHTGTDFRGVDDSLIKLFDPVPPPYALGWPATLMFVQPELERLIRTRISETPTIDAFFGKRLTGIVESEDKVVAVVEGDGPAKASQVSAKLLVGCDGAASAVRSLAGLPLEDQRFDEWWIVVDAHLRRKTDLPSKTTQYCRPARPGTYVVGPGNLRRWEIKILPHENPDRFRDEQHMSKVLSQFVDLDALDIWRSAVYRFHALVATKWSTSRVLIAGDAAHQMPPFLGQGLCGGLRDAFNLAWKIVQVEKRGARRTLLETYEEERKPHVTAVVAHAKEFGQIIGELDPQRALARDAELRDNLQRGEMETRRQKFIPDLTTGLIADRPFAGTLFVQPYVHQPNGKTLLLDDIVPMEFLFVTDKEEMLHWPSAVEDQWQLLGGRKVLILPSDAKPPTTLPRDALVLREVASTFGDWLDGLKLRAAIVRPDRYVYAPVFDSGDATEEVCKLARLLLGEPVCAVSN